MSTTDTPPVTLDRVTEAVQAVGFIPFVSATGQVAAILPNRTVRIAVPEGHPVQGVADYPRFFDPSHADEIASAVRRLNASTYLPKVTSAITDTGAIALHLQHTFNWVVGATDAQVNAEVSQFIMASISMMNQLDVMFPDQWTKEAANA
ncbi:histidine kinase [Schaalia odontolytica]|uniref:histidine kinase n=1 Tax=Schaalia odontolytica TaxID=1660 RepID=UPI001D072DF6|nr:histidine kinase [Schaalia odontolytica]MCB6401795.1 histidine kinase [Schaalia odontolytica]MEE0239788.1 histidine kinase [Pauljensenia sp.]